MIGEQAAQPSAARPHDRVALEPLAADERRVAVGRGAPAHQLRAVRARLPRQRLHRPLRAHHAGLGLVEHERQVVGAEAGEEPRGVAGLSRSHGMPCAGIARSDSASQPSSRCANQAMPISAIRSSPVSPSSSRQSVRARRADAV